MKKHTDSISKAVLCCFFSFFFLGLSAQIDLSLQMMADPADPDIYANAEVSVTVSNTGTATASGIQIEFPKPNQTVYTGGNEWTATQGSFLPFGNETWSVGNLAAGASATLTVSYFMLTEDAVTAYAQVTTANGSDSDSTPGNGTCCTPNEDDEASFAINGGTSFCEIRADARNFVCNDNGTPNDGSDDTYMVDVFCQIIDGTSCGSTFTVMGQSAPYGSTVTVGPFNLLGSNSALDVTDSNDPSISDFVSILNHNGTCSDIADECAGGILPNGQMELGFNNWNLYSSAATTTLSFSGIRALSIQNDDNGLTFSQTIDIQAGVSYEVSGYVEEGNGTGAMIYRYLDANGQVISTPTMSSTPVGSWDFYESTSTAPAGAVKMEVGGTGTPAAPVKYDAYCVRPVNTNPCSPDVIAPIIAGCPSNISQTTNGSSANVSWAPPTASDNCTNSPSLTSTHQPGSSFPIGSTTVIYTATDNAGNSSNCSFTVTVNQQGGGGDIDLELSLSQPNANPDQWTSYSVIATLNNTGGQTATGVKVHFPRPSGVTYTGGNEYAVSQGDFMPFGTEEWNVGSIPAGGSATLEVNYFLLLNDAPTAYAQVSAANENDSDSTPGNGTPPTPNEDDEASTDGGSGNNCAISSDITDLQCSDNNSPNNPNDDTFTFDIIVNSNGDCAPFYSVTVGGNTTSGFSYGQSNTFGPYPISGGSVAMTFTDQMDATATLSINVTPPPTCSNGGGGSGCSFTTYYTPVNLSPLSLTRELSLLEDANGYTVFQNTEYEPTFSPSTASDTYELDLNGNVISETQVPVTSDYEVLVETDASNNVKMVFVQSPDLPNGTEVPIDINYVNPTDVIVNSRAVKTSNGYAFGIGIVDVSQSPNIINRVIQTDNFGQNVVISELTDPAFYAGFGRLVEGSDGSIFTEWRASGNFSLFTVPADGSAPWQVRVASDTPSSDWVETEASHDGQFVYTMKTDNLHTFLAKYNVSTGDLVGIDLVDLKTSAVPNGFRQTYASGIEPTADGGLLVSLRANEVVGNSPGFFVLAKYDAADNLVWKQEVPDPDPDYDLTPVGETADGGALFAGRDVSFPADQTVFLKTAANGALMPECGGNFPQPDLHLADLNIENSPVAAGQVLTYNFDASNLGNALAAGDFTIKAYISTDNTLSNDDIQDGTILTGNYGAGITIADVVGASTVPASLSPGQYYLILKIDADDEITESNEGNNVEPATFEVMDSNPSDECGFFQEFGAYPSANGFNLGFARANETLNGYGMVIKGSKSFPDDEQRTIRLNTDFDGNQIGFTDITVAVPPVLEGVFVEVEPNYDLTVERRGINGQPIWTSTVSLTFNNGTILDVSAGKGAEISNGYLIFGNIVADVNGTIDFFPWSLKMDFNGNEVQQNLLPIQDNISNFSNPMVSPTGELYFTRQQINLIELYKLDNNGAYQWDAFVASDLPSTYLRSIRFSKDGSKIYAAVRDNLKAEVNVYDAATGNSDILVLGNLFSPNGEFTYFENILDVIPTDDGGFVAGYSFDEPGTPNEGFEWGKIDANNNMEWWHQVPERHNLVTALAASNGGYVFVGSSENGNMAMMKVTSTGELTPTCNNNATCLYTPPVITSANMINDVLVVNWTEVPGAMGYFFESEVPGTNISSGILINGTEANITTWLPGLTYELKVRALCATPNIYSPYSNTVSFLTPNTNQPDLIMEGYQVLTANPVAGGDVRVVIEMRNGGGSDAQNVQVDVSINTSAIPTFLGSFTGLTAFAGQTGFYEMTFQIPCSVNPGNYTLAVTADPQNVIVEGDEGNNTFSGGGLFFPIAACGSGPCDDITITTGNGSLTINGATSDHVIIKVFDPNWGTAFDCLDTCPDPLTISGLDGGEHYVTIKLLDDNWVEICDLKEFIDVPDPFNGGGGNFLAAPEFKGRPIRLLGIQPNPALYGKTTAVILSNEEGLYDLEVYDVLGRKVISQKTLLEKGRNEIRLDISDFRDGTYYLNLPGHNWKYMPVRFVVARW